ncbi:hypothetical protein HYH03_004317 [Edaphochlamys debaryana]|uniref:Protein kinase domain-containing protein n=1 Tax=Edaphochlamys debaryana TaxID=47281 RepID=A0A835YB42_9CHLO|nr:hypothetical protein HYH03_004317 [Edaphochlamys debaryana]|eukprot:KAG2497571.1 hypothetical protein HYH03_004317 [Edaphochlamys debaryana]
MSAGAYVEGGLPAGSRATEAQPARFHAEAAAADSLSKTSCASAAAGPATRLGHGSRPPAGAAAAETTAAAAASQLSPLLGQLLGDVVELTPIPTCHPNALWTGVLGSEPHERVLLRFKALPPPPPPHPPKLGAADHVGKTGGTAADSGGMATTPPPWRPLMTANCTPPAPPCSTIPLPAAGEERGGSAGEPAAGGGPAPRGGGGTGLPLAAAAASTESLPLARSSGSSSSGSSSCGTGDDSPLHPHRSSSLVRVYDVRSAVVDRDSWLELFPLPVLRPGWPGHRLGKHDHCGRLRRVLEAAGVDPTAMRPKHPYSGSLTVYPGDILASPPPPSSAHRALASTPGLVPGARVTVTIMEHCLLGNLLSVSRSRPSPFLASGRPAWPLRMAQQALLRTARDVARGLRALHASGAAHGALHPANVLLAASHTALLGFEARVADAGSATLEEMAAVGPSSPWRAFGGGKPWAASLAPETYARPSAVHTPAADVYAYGMLLYLMATGELPRQVAQPALLRRDAALGELEAPAWPPAGEHGHLAPLYAACVDPDPSRRPTAGQVLEAIAVMAAQGL